MSGHRPSRPEAKATGNKTHLSQIGCVVALALLLALVIWPLSAIKRVLGGGNGRVSSSKRMHKR